MPTVESPRYQGPYAFVNCSAGNLKGPSLKFRVRSHIQSDFSRWSRQKQLARVSIDSGLDRKKTSEDKFEENWTQAATVKDADIAKESAALHARAWVGIVTAAEAKHASVWKWPQRREAGRRSAALGSRRAVSPMTILQNGNSDPFSTYAIQITPEINYNMRFFRDIVIPEYYHTNSHGWKHSKTANKEWYANIENLEDQGNALSFLARNFQVGAVVTGNSFFVDQALKCQVTSYNLLRDRLGHGEVATSVDVLRQIRLLWCTEILARNLPAATIHSKMIRRLLERMSQEDALDLAYLRAITYNDVQLCCMFMVRSVFDYFDWIPRMYAPLHAAVAADLPDFEEIRSRFLHPNIENPVLRRIFVERRESIEMWKLGGCTSEGMSPPLFSWIASRQHTHQGQLITLSVDALADLEACSTKQDIGRLGAHAYLALSALFWTRGNGTHAYIYGVEVYPTQRPNLDKIRFALEVALEGQEPSDREKYGDAMLWALFVGAQGEQRLPDGGRWFRDQLAQLAIERGVFTWQDLRDILTGFLYGDLAHPHGSLWVGKILGDKLAAKE